MADQSLHELVERIADPKQFSGGGAVAALTLAGSAAAAELVVRLALRRKSLASRRSEIEQILAAIGQLRPPLLAAADRDIAVLDQLLKAQRAARAAAEGDAKRQAETAVQQALEQAALAPIELAQDGVRLLHLIERALPFAARFTVPDLGAAAAMANGAIEAALLMSEVNLALLGDHPSTGPLGATISHIRQEAPATANDVLHLTRAKIAGALGEEVSRG